MDDVRFIQAFLSSKRARFDEHAGAMWIALDEARRSFNPNRAQLSTFATMLMKRALKQRDDVIRIPKTTAQRHPELRDRFRVRPFGFHDPSNPATRPIDHPPIDNRWTPKEQEVLTLMYRGLSFRQIAASLAVQPQTIRKCAVSAKARKDREFKSRKSYWRRS